METVGLVCLYGITAFDDVKTRHIRLAELLLFALIGIVIDIIRQPYSLISILGGVGVGVALLAFSFLSKGKIGVGDALIVMVSGLYLGFINTLVMVWLSSLVAAGFGIAMIIKKRDTKEREIPFVPFMLVAYLILIIVNTVGGALCI